MCGIKAAFAQRGLDRAENVSDFDGMGKAARGRFIRIDDGGKACSWQGLQNLGMGSGDHTGADETDALHSLVPFALRLIRCRFAQTARKASKIRHTM